MPDLSEQLLRRVRRLASAPDHAPDSDAGLLCRFVRERDEDSFAALVNRYGGLVLGVCRRVLRDAHEADDASQAVWLVLARKAREVRPTGLAAWLHGVARQVSLNVLRASARRRRAAQGAASDQVPARPEPLDELTARELLAMLDREVRGLPEAERLPVVLCCLEGLSQEEAARRLGCTPGSIKGRLERGRKRLIERLAGRGLILSTVLAVSLPPALPGSIAVAALRFAAGQAAEGASNARAAVLAKGVLRAMFLTRCKIAVVLLLSITVVGAAAALLTRTAKDPATAVADKPKTDKDRLQGTWIAVSVEEGGKKVPEKEVKAKGFEMVFTPDKVTLPIKDDSKEVGYKLDSTRNPKQIDLFLGKDKTAKAIYLLEGKTLKLCVEKDPDGERPTRFTTAGTTHFLIVLKKK